VDVIGADEDGRRPAPAWLFRPPARLVGGLLAAALLGGGSAAALLEEPGAAGGSRPGAAVPETGLREAGLPDAGLPEAGRSVPARSVVQLRVLSGTAGGGPESAEGELSLEVSNLTDARVRLGQLTLQAPGLVVTDVRPAFGRPLAPRETREYALAYQVPTCRLLLLPAQLRVSYLQPGGARAEGLALGPGLQPAPFAACAPGSTRTLRPDLAVRAIGGSSQRVGPGARGSVQLEVRNAGVALRLLAVTAEVPGVRFVDEGQPNGLPLGPDDRVEVALGFVVQDCARLRRTGRLVLRALQAGVESEVALTVTTDAEAGTVRQLALDRVLESCGS